MDGWMDMDGHLIVYWSVVCGCAFTSIDTRSFSHAEWTVYLCRCDDFNSMKGHQSNFSFSLLVTN